VAGESTRSLTRGPEDERPATVFRVLPLAKMFPDGFRALGLGKLVGVPTSGQVIGTGSFNPLDRSAIRTPGAGRHAADFAAGHDGQIEKAIETLKGQLQGAGGTSIALLWSVVAQNQGWLTDDKTRSSVPHLFPRTVFHAGRMAGAAPMQRSVILKPVISLSSTRLPRAGAGRSARWPR
jgi:hypothetical protein